MCVGAKRPSVCVLLYLLVYAYALYTFLVFAYNMLWSLEHGMNFVQNTPEFCGYAGFLCVGSLRLPFNFNALTENHQIRRLLPSNLVSCRKVDVLKHPVLVKFLVHQGYGPAVRN